MNIEEFKIWCESYDQAFSIGSHQKPLIMGVLNVTPDSFSDGGKYYQLQPALEHARQMIIDGADLIDIGGESSKPGARPVSWEEELDRVIPVIRQLRTETDICISIDTTKAQVMHAAISEGASIINDIAGFRSRESLAMAAQLDVPLCLMHMQGEPLTMQDAPNYQLDVEEELNLYFEQKIATCVAAGIKAKNLIIDPGFGFGKTVEHNMRIVKQLAKFKRHNRPIMLGVSRKSTLGAILNAPVDKRLAGGLALAVYASLQGVSIIRTHDVAETNQALLMVQAINEAGKNEKAGEQ
ncbi:Dihydropteroate synthase [Legionella massiliensis]|uniref:Dihydropteroate synthase n=1 Tax=Legionella massiliensis TaxID=1034943 RepID=A0A078KW23_9GAMM|nr:dihydropteroate synthase [Legionella massiliensis]CDZ75944.1 Dihydropteroate synthase [Legionella massiliensis]CEE11682.1 Dihydropteroate synthase [Legionella massiliensis]